MIPTETSHQFKENLKKADYPPIFLKLYIWRVCLNLSHKLRAQFSAKKMLAKWEFKFSAKKGPAQLEI